LLDEPFARTSIRLVHVNQEIADAADDENGGNGPENQYGHFLLQTLFERLRQAHRAWALLFGADLGGLHGGLGFSLGLVDAVAHDGGGDRRRLGVDNGALLGCRVADDLEFGGAGGLRAESESGEGAHDQHLHECASSNGS
jgi:hypothetical protein